MEYVSAIVHKYAYQHNDKIRAHVSCETIGLVEDVSVSLWKLIRFNPHHLVSERTPQTSGPGPTTTKKKQLDELAQLCF